MISHRSPKGCPASAAKTSTSCAKTEDEPLIDSVAPAIVFPTIIRNTTTTGQGEPLGFIFAVDGYYDQNSA
ncbi:MAG: hypothetical protein R2873_33430 [Caldilineaceae bacterium]